MNRLVRSYQGSWRRRSSRFALAAACLIGVSSASLAQTQPAPVISQQKISPAPAQQTATSLPLQQKSDSNQLVPLFGWRDALLALGFAAATVGMFKLDEYVAEKSQKQVNQANQFLKTFSKPSEYLAWPGGLIIEGGLYVGGKLRHRKRAAEVGWHGAEAMILANSITGILKKTVGRARPFATADTNAHDFKFLGGFGNESRTSFPSGHTTTAFAFAAAVASESRVKWPNEWWSKWAIPAAAYGGATVVGVSRMYHNKHWASDVTLGAAIGLFSGIKVVQYTHEHPNNRLDRIMLGTHVVPNGKRGVTLGWSLPTR